MIHLSLALSFALATGCTLSPSPEPAEAPSQAATPAAADLPLPTESLYHLDLPLLNQRGEPTRLAVHEGHPVIVSMFYASCPTACPMLIRDILNLEEQLPPDQRAALRVLLVSLDPERDTPELLTQVVADHSLDTDRWTLTRAEPDDVRSIAAALGIRYRATADGEMNHSSVLTLLDARGRPVTRLEGLQRENASLREAIARAAQ